MLHSPLLRRGRPYLLPTVLRCPTHEHALANRELFSPFASVVEVNGTEFPAVAGSSLVVTAITPDRKRINRLLAAPFAGRLNLGAIPTDHSQWHQPHEGNLFDHLYSRSVLQRALEAVAS